MQDSLDFGYLWNVNTINVSQLNSVIFSFYQCYLNVYSRINIKYNSRKCIFCSKNVVEEKLFCSSLSFSSEITNCYLVIILLSLVLHSEIQNSDVQSTERITCTYVKLVYSAFERRRTYVDLIY